MISKGSLVRYINPHAAQRGAEAALALFGLCYNGVYLTTSEPYITERRRQARMGWACKVLVEGRPVIVDMKNLEEVE